MNITAIRQGIADLIGDVDGIMASMPYFPEFLSGASTPAAMLGDAYGPVTMGAREIWTYNIPLTVAIVRLADYDSEVVAVESFVEPIMQAIEANFTLDYATMGLAVTEFREGIVRVADEQFVGFTLILRVKEVGVRNLS
jgi:hypothetical protein